MTRDEIIRMAREACAKVCDEGSNALGQPGSWYPALAEPEPEPVALPCCGYANASAVQWNPYNHVVQCHNCGQTYAPAPPTRTPLTDEEIDALWRAATFRGNGGQRDWFVEGIRAAERAQGITGRLYTALLVSGMVGFVGLLVWSVK